MARLWRSLRQRKLVQWASVCPAVAWVLPQVQGLATDSNDWPRSFMQIAFVVAPAWNRHVFDQGA